MRTSVDLAEEMDRLRTTRPRPLKKVYGERGPTPEQAAAHADAMRVWTSAYRCVNKEHAVAARVEKDWWANASEKERAERVRSRYGADEHGDQPDLACQASVDGTEKIETKVVDVEPKASYGS